MKKLINLTPHPINIMDGGKIVKTYPSEGFLRVSTEVKNAGFTVDDIPIVETKFGETTFVFGETEGLPEYNLGTFYIVSQIVKTANSNRSDLLVPANIVRDQNGNIIGCESLSR